MLKAFFREYYERDIQINENARLPICKTVEIECIGSFTLESPRENVIISFYDSPGYGDFINNQSAIVNVNQFLLNAHKRWVNIDGNKLSEQVIRKSWNHFYFVGNDMFYFVAKKW